jgi:hypothetical protein
MATVTTFVDGISASQPIGTQLSVVHNVLDFSATSVSAADVVQCLKIPKDGVLMHFGWEVQTAEGDTCTCTAGDDDGGDTVDASINLNSAATGKSLLGTDASVHKHYTSADTIDLTMGHDTDAAIIYVWAILAYAERS